MAIRTVDLTEHFEQFIEAGVNSGRFSDANEAVQEGLTLLERREEQEQADLEWFRAAAKAGFDSLDRGEGTVLRTDEEITAFVRGLRMKSAVQAR